MSPACDAPHVRVTAPSGAATTLRNTTRIPRLRGNRSGRVGLGAFGRALRGRAESGRKRLLLAHIGTLLGLPVARTVAGVEELRAQIGPDHGVRWTAGLGLAFGRELPLAERHWRPRRGSSDRHPAAFRDEDPFGLAARLDRGLVRGPFVIALPGRLLLRENGLRARQQSQHGRAHSGGDRRRFHHTCLPSKSRQPRPTLTGRAGENALIAFGFVATRLPVLADSGPYVLSLFPSCQEQK